MLLGEDIAGSHSMLSGCSQAAFLSPLHPSLAAPSPGEDKLGVSEVGEGSMKQRKERGCGSGRPEFKPSRTSLGVSEELPVPLGYQRCQPCIPGGAELLPHRVRSVPPKLTARCSRGSALPGAVALRRVLLRRTDSWPSSAFSLRAWSPVSARDRGAGGLKLAKGRKFCLSLNR